jgi:hypothetical protein
MAAAVNCGESVCTIGICYVVKKIINVKLQKKIPKISGGGYPCGYV